MQPRLLYTVSCVVCPSLLIIDHGHFQYNGVCIGLSLCALYAISNGTGIVKRGKATATSKGSSDYVNGTGMGWWGRARYDMAASVLYCLSLNFKQMALYYAPVFFLALLGRCWVVGRRPTGVQDLARTLQHFALIAATVIVTFAVMWLPFCFAASAHASESGRDTCVPALLQVLHRIFPFSRGIFEDKVSNLWYVLSVVIDVRRLADASTLLRCALALTCVLLLPVGISIWHVVMKRGGQSFNHPLLLLLAMTCSALSFFLASFQVHEKSLLLALVPAALLLPYEPLLVCWFQVLGMFTMYPLLLRDSLGGAYACCITIYLRLVINYYGASPPSRFQTVKVAFVLLSFLGMLALHAAWQLREPPTRYPDLYPALFSLYGAVQLVVAYVLSSMWLLHACGVVNFGGLWNVLASASASAQSVNMDEKARAVSAKKAQ